MKPYILYKKFEFKFMLLYIYLQHKTASAVDNINNNFKIEFGQIQGLT